MPVGMLQKYPPPPPPPSRVKLKPVPGASMLDAWYLDATGMEPKRWSHVPKEDGRFFWHETR